MDGRSRPVRTGLRSLAGVGNRAAASGGWTGALILVVAIFARPRTGLYLLCSVRCSLNSGVLWGLIL